MRGTLMVQEVASAGVLVINKDRSSLKTSDLLQLTSSTKDVSADKFCFFEVNG